MGDPQGDSQGRAATARGARRALRAPGFAGLLLGLVFWWQSLTPTLVPRSWVTQAVVTGVCAALGYGCGSLFAWACRRILVRQGWSAAPRRWAWIALGAGWLVVVLVGCVLWLDWQNSQRDLMGLPPLPGWSVMPMVAMAVAVWALLLGAARVVSAGAGALHTRRGRLIPGTSGAVAATLAVAVVVLLAGGLAPVAAPIL